MRENQTRIEWTGNIEVHHPIKPGTQPVEFVDWERLREAV